MALLANPKHTDITVTVKGDGPDKTFALHKYPLVTNSVYFSDEIPDSSGKVTLELSNFPGGAHAFEVAIQHCYGVKVELTVENIAPVYCAAKVLQMTPLIALAEAFMKEKVLSDPVKAAVVLRVATGIHHMTEKMMTELVGESINAIAGQLQTPFPELNALTPECFVVIMTTTINREKTPRGGDEPGADAVNVKTVVEQAVLQYLAAHCSANTSVTIDIEQFLSICASTRRMDNMVHNREVFRKLEFMLNHFTKDSDADMLCKGLHELGFWVCLPHETIEEAYKNSLIPDRYCVVALMAENRHLIRANAELATQLESIPALGLK